MRERERERVKKERKKGTYLNKVKEFKVGREKERDKMQWKEREEV